MNFGLIALFVKVRVEIRVRAKTIVTSLSRDIYSDRVKNNIVITFRLSVFHVL